ncbi:pyridoxal phosphate-dependent aminotransferase [Streptomyces sp. SID13031]|uniref:pyridoxal phosphate-dependent aminotransferase n=1 Tax=Streptomyces sp. SID13031 TaxID=2706046 RepID=UPI0013CD3BED|nr:pyridoxal phosphate-dependent aminotransferase [Streptomyces sp. SID13031]NEA36021.1 pyridoxal phosphate-dependent aminotransferase [Streptomyces sp. SID13031]
MREHAQRLQGLGTTIFAEMSALAVRTGSVNLGQGFPDTDGPDSLLEDAVAAIRGGANQYPPGRGIPALRQAIVDHQKRFYDLSYDPDTQVLVTTGATEAIAASLLAYVEPGDEVIALEPYYDSYAACIAMAGGRRVPVTLRAPDFRLDLDELRAAVTPRTKVLLINSPHNPTGTVLDDTELRGIAAIAVEHDLVVITDEVYEHLIFDGLQHLPLTAYEGMAERTVSIGSAGKTFSVTGWKIGWITGSPSVVTAVNTAKQFLTYVSGAPFQPAVAGALALGNDYFGTLRSTMQAKRDFLCDGLQSLGFGVHRPQGTYFVTTDIRPLGHTDGIDFCRMLPERTGVVAIPTQVFYDNTEAGRPLVRWAFCKKPEVLEEALTRLTKL